MEVMTVEMVENSDIKKCRSRPRVIYTYSDYKQSLIRYIQWIKEQISKNKKGFIIIRRADLAIAMKNELSAIMGDRYKDITFNSLYTVIKVVLYNEGIFARFAHCDGERVFIMRNITPKDCMSPALKNFEKSLKGRDNDK